MTRPINWLISPLPVLKFAVIVCLLLAAVFFLDGRDQWPPYTIIFLLCFGFLVAEALSIAIHYFDIPRANKNIPWIQIEVLLNVLGFLFCAASVVTLAWDWFRLNNNMNRHHYRGPPVTIGYDGWQRRVGVVMFVLGITSLIFLVTIGRVKKAGLQ